jgi:hypothetical protein
MTTGGRLGRDAGRRDRGLSSSVGQRYIVAAMDQGGPVVGGAANGSTGVSPMKKPKT